MADRRTRLIRDFVTSRAEDVERETGKTATPAQLQDAHREADSRVDDYLEGWSGNV